MNFAPSVEEQEDNDYYRLWVKEGATVTCETFDLGPGVDTNLILYDANRNGLAGNDDVNSAYLDLSSRLTVQVHFSGWLYVLVGQGRALSAEDALLSSYGLTCYGGEPTPTPLSSTAAAELGTPSSPYPYPAGVPSPTPGLALPRNAPTPITILAAPVTSQYQVAVRIFYDVLADGMPGAGEGIPDVRVALLDTQSHELIVEYTDEFGCTFLGATGPLVRLSVPYLAVDVPLQPGWSEVYVVVQAASLPNAMP